MVYKYDKFVNLRQSHSQDRFEHGDMCYEHVMKRTSIYLMFATVLLDLGHSGCVRENWWSSFDREGTSRCTSQRLIRGFFRSKTTGGDQIYLLEEADCCDMTSPWFGFATQSTNANWWYSLDTNNRWSYCPSGYFLEGLYRTDDKHGWLHNIEEGRCTKPRDHPNYHGQCYNHDISTCFDNENLCKCDDGYFVTGLYRGNCNALYCLETLRCCKMASGREALDEVSKIKTRTMDRTLMNMALLANYLGYGWCYGCRSLYVGEGFTRVTDTWKADTSVACSGHKSDHRLSMVYGDWSFGVKDIKFGNAVSEDLIPVTIDSGTIYNHDQHEATKTISRSETSVTTVTHTTTSSWKHAHELGIEINFPFGVGGASYKFAYENSMTTEDSKSKEHSKTFEVSTSKTLSANTSASWRLVMINSRKTIPYTATVITRFSTELQGFLRWGGGYNGDSTNYHINYRGSEDRPTFNYRFGDARTPLCTALKRQSDTNSQPWMWNDMKHMYSNVQNVINNLCYENNYVFTLTGQFEAVEGKHVDLYWETVKPVTKRSADNKKQKDEDNGVVKYLKQVAQPGPYDIPAPTPPPPEIKIDSTNAETDSTNIPVSLSIPAQGD